jgi:hypothetical protein
MEKWKMTAYLTFLDGKTKRFDRSKAKPCGRTICDETVYRTASRKQVFFNRDSRKWNECTTGQDLD